MKQTLQSHFLPSVSHLLTDGRIDPTSQKTFLADLHTSAVQAAISQLAPNPVLQRLQFAPSPCREGGTFLSSFQPQTTPLCHRSTPDAAISSTPAERGLARPKTRPVPLAARLTSDHTTVHQSPVRFSLSSHRFTLGKACWGGIFPGSLALFFSAFNSSSPSPRRDGEEVRGNNQAVCSHGPWRLTSQVALVAFKQWPLQQTGPLLPPKK